MSINKRIGILLYTTKLNNLGKDCNKKKAPQNAELAPKSETL